MSDKVRAFQYKMRSGIAVFLPERFHVSHFKGALSESVRVLMTLHIMEHVVVDFGMNETLFVHPHYILIATGPIVTQKFVQFQSIPPHHMTIPNGIIWQEPILKRLVL